MHMYNYITSYSAAKLMAVNLHISHDSFLNFNSHFWVFPAEECTNCMEDNVNVFLHLG